MGKDHNNVGGAYVIILPPGTGLGDRVVGYTGPRHEQRTINPTTGAPDPNGIVINPRHVHTAIHEYLGFQSTAAGGLGRAGCGEAQAVQSNLSHRAPESACLITSTQPRAVAALQRHGALSFTARFLSSRATSHAAELRGFVSEGGAGVLQYQPCVGGAMSQQLFPIDDKTPNGSLRAGVGAVRQIMLHRYRPLVRRDAWRARQDQYDCDINFRERSAPSSRASLCHVIYRRTYACLLPARGRSGASLVTDTAAVLDLPEKVSLKLPVAAFKAVGTTQAGKETSASHVRCIRQRRHSDSRRSQSTDVHRWSVRNRLRCACDRPDREARLAGVRRALLGKGLAVQRVRLYCGYISTARQKSLSMCERVHEWKQV